MIREVTGTPEHQSLSNYAEYTSFHPNLNEELTIICSNQVSQISLFYLYQDLSHSKIQLKHQLIIEQYRHYLQKNIITPAHQCLNFSGESTELPYLACAISHIQR